MREIKMKMVYTGADNKKHLSEPFTLHTLSVSLDDIKTSPQGIPLCDDAEYILSTGLKDKNGKEIYEGDVVKEYRGADFCGVCGEYVREIIFNKGAFTFARTKYDTLPDCRNVEVIGNIYENPELLKE